VKKEGCLEWEAVPQLLERDFSLQARTRENYLINHLQSSAEGVPSLVLGGRSQWCCLCPSLIHLVTAEESSHFPKTSNTRQGRDGNLTGLFQDQ